VNMKGHENLGRRYPWWYPLWKPDWQFLTEVWEPAQWDYERVWGPERYEKKVVLVFS
jgi:hypothetical protein